MDIKNILQSLTNIEGSLQENSKVHKGTYGTSYQPDDIKDQYGQKIASGKKEEPADSTQSRGRGRPKKGSDETGNVPKYDFSQFGGDKKVNLPKWDKSKTVKHSLKDWIETIDQNTLNEDGFTTQPLPGAVAVKDATGKVVATAKNQQAADMFKKGDISIDGEETQGMAEDDELYGRAGINSVNKFARNGQTNLRNIPAGNHPGSKNKFSDQQRDSQLPRLKAAITKSLGKHVTPNLPESVDLSEGVLTDSKRDIFNHILNTFKYEVKQFQQTGDLDEDLYNALYDYYFDDMPYGTMKARTGDPYEFVAQRFQDDLPLDENSKQNFTTHGMNSKPSTVMPASAEQPKTSFARDPIMATTNAAYDAVSSGAKKAGSFIRDLVAPKKTFESKDSQFENWEKELNSLLTEGFNISTSTGQQGAPDSVSINATDSDAQELLSIIRQAGLGVFGGEAETSQYGAPMQGDTEGHGTAPEMSPEVVGDGDDMLALIKKMSGIEDGNDEHQELTGDASSDYEDEESEQQEPNDEEEMEEGNAYLGARADAIKKGQGSFKSPNGETEKVTGDTSDEEEMEEGNAYLGARKDAIQAGEKTFKSPNGETEKVTGDTSDEEEMDEAEHDHEEMCNECGMYESDCGCEEQVEEAFSNEAGNHEMVSLKALLSMGNDMHRIKRDQSVGNITKVTTESEISDWKKLSGIK